MTTPINVMQAAAEEIGAYDPGQPINAADTDRLFKSLNSMLDSWSNENLACFAFLTQSTPMVIGKQSYTVGPGGDVDTVRPLKIQQAYSLDAVNDTFNINILEQYDWNLISNRLVTSQIPTVLFYDPQFPLGIINLYPVPMGGGNEPYTLYWTSYLQISRFANPYVDIELPPGYEDALVHNLAVRAYPFFGIQPNPLVVELASETKGIVKRTNIRLDLAYYDRAIVARAGSAYDIFSDSYGNRGGIP